MHSASFFPSISLHYIYVTFHHPYLINLLTIIRINPSLSLFHFHFKALTISFSLTQTVTFVHITFFLSLPFPSHSTSLIHSLSSISLSFSPLNFHIKATTISLSLPHSVTLVHIALTLPPNIHLRVLISCLILFCWFLSSSTQLLKVHQLLFLQVVLPRI